MKIAVLMSTYNGKKYIKEQIDSILKQREVEVYLYIRDDGSSDGTDKIIYEYEKKYPNIMFINKENRVNLGINKGILEFLHFAKDNIIDIDYYSYADQDDIWLDDKLISAVKQINTRIKSNNINDQPVLYYCKKTWTDENMNVLYDDKIIDTKGNYFDMFMPTSAYGCTFVFNRCLLEKTIEGPPSYLLAYDSYMHRLARLINGIIIADNTSHILHRRHNNNVSGGPTRFSPIKFIARKISNKQAFHGVQSYVQEIYNIHCDDMGEEQKYLSDLVLGYEKSFRKKIKLLFYKEAYNRGLKLAIIWMGRVILNAV